MQVLWTVTLVNLVVCFIFACVTIYNARISTRNEIRAAMASAEHLIDDISSAASAEGRSKETIITQLAATPNYRRHIRFSVVDAQGREVPPPQATIEQERAPPDYADAPSWFRRLIEPAPMVDKVVLAPDGETVGSVIIAGEPSDEIDEVWRNFKSLMMVVLSGSAAVLAVLSIFLGWVLRPLTTLTHGLKMLQSADYSVRLSQSPVKEIGDLATGFNSLAETLERTRDENIALNRSLVFAHDNERRRIAFELHDEFGPCLFGIKADVDSLEAITDDLRPDLAAKFHSRVQDILGVVDRLQAVNRGMLKSLRPMALGHVALESLLRDLIASFERTSEMVSYTVAIGPLARAYDETLDLTLYRCIQESLTNIARHAAASRVIIEVRETASPRTIEASIADNGRGIGSSAVPGYGISGMRERVQALGGKMDLASREGGGTEVRFTLPLTAQSTRNILLHREDAA